MQFRRIAVILIGAFMPAIAAAPAAADELHLADGSRIVGLLVGLDEGVITIDTTFAGTLSIEVSNISALMTDGPVAVWMASGDRVVGRFVMTDGQQMLVDTQFGEIPIELGTVRAVTGTDQPSPEVTRLQAEQVQHHEAEVVRLREEHEATLAEVQERLKAVEPIWTGRLQIGVNGKTGNTERASFNGELEFNRETSSDRLKIYARGSWAKDNGVRTDNEIIGGARLEVDRTDRMFLFASGELEFDEFEDLDLRSTVAAGVGYFVVKKDVAELKVRLGAGYQHQSFTNNSTTDDAVLEAGYDFRRDLNETLRFTQSVTWYPSVTESFTSDYRLKADTAIEVPIVADERWKLRAGVRNDYDASPVMDIERLDSTYYLNLVLDW